MCRATVTLVKYNTGNAERVHEKETDREKERKREEGNQVATEAIKLALSRYEHLTRV